MFKSGFWLSGFAVFLVISLSLAVGCGLWTPSVGQLPGHKPLASLPPGHGHSSHNADYDYDIYIGHSDYPPRGFVFCVVEYNSHFYYGTIGADLSVTLLGLHYSWDTVQEISSTGNFLVVQQQGSQEIFVYEINLP